MQKEDVFDALYDIDTWDDFFTEDELKSIQDYIDLSIERGMNVCAVRFLMEESKDSFYPYYIWIVIDIEDEAIGRIKVYIPNNWDSMLEAPIELDKYMKLEREWK